VVDDTAAAVPPTAEVAFEYCGNLIMSDSCIRYCEQLYLTSLERNLDESNKRCYTNLLAD